MKSIVELKKAKLKSLESEITQLDGKDIILKSIFKEFHFQCKNQINSPIFGVNRLKIEEIENELFNIKFAGLTVTIKLSIFLGNDSILKGFLVCQMVKPNKDHKIVAQLTYDDAGKSDLIGNEHLPLNITNDKDAIEVILKWLERCVITLKH
jgi:hypothetical protein